MPTYTPTTFETFENISRDQLGSEIYASIIRVSNPHIVAVLGPAGGLGVPPFVPVYIPDILAPVSKPNPLELDEVILFVDKKEVKFWETIAIENSVDGLSQVNFNIPFDPNDKNHRELFKPFTYKTIELFIGEKLQFKGIMLVNPPNVQTNRIELSLNCYAAPGVLNDCTASSEAFPIEFNDMNLEDIAKSLCEPFAIAVEAKDDVGDAFDRTALEAGQKNLPYLIGLAKQRNILVRSGSNGSLVLHRAKTDGSPVATLVEGNSPLISIKPTFNQQEYYSSITGIQPTQLGFLGGDKYTANNELLDSSFRPLNFKANDTEDGTLKDAVDAKLSRMFGQVASYTCDVVDWRDKSGKLWEPNTIIQVQAPSAMIYSQYNFLISRVNGPKIKKTTLTLSLPGSYSGKIPAKLPWS
jgi:prophage tail gpP-like protein